jgi:hypothetical protein
LAIESYCHLVDLSGAKGEVCILFTMCTSGWKIERSCAKEREQQGFTPRLGFSADRPASHERYIANKQLQPEQRHHPPLARACRKQGAAGSQGEKDMRATPCQAHFPHLIQMNPACCAG